jgi:hypothetical protein
MRLQTKPSQVSCPILGILELSTNSDVIEIVAGVSHLELKGV